MCRFLRIRKSNGSSSLEETWQILCHLFSKVATTNVIQYFLPQYIPFSANSLHSKVVMKNSQSMLSSRLIHLCPAGKKKISQNNLARSGRHHTVQHSRGSQAELPTQDQQPRPSPVTREWRQGGTTGRERTEAGLVTIPGLDQWVCQKLVT